jgi:hypothetical protein
VQHPKIKVGVMELHPLGKVQINVYFLYILLLFCHSISLHVIILKKLMTLFSFKKLKRKENKRKEK